MMKLHQTKKIEEMLERFDLGSLKRIVRMPMLSNEGVRKTPPEKLENFDRSKIHCRNAIGALLYFANATRLDIAHSVNSLSRR